ncbi:MAG: peptidoglycan editing factor PgeF [Gammaproteobacteria bacterium]|nr:peptidoglycan editing factor PgeF [Gammaproteobacteria bacterium]NIR97796.1 peptidoglycan editing factor PgeF [Gammaproteobacteria bacterium]NIT63496.1 peptidoglycan editing factor PgeF [Gammaproteobacteria bacterium]NIV20443.1 peptidoglycan editing factor PgeF [Gammaproteobacteria bacterium]NIX11025.1 peptidoglycan editing factor PgeF [Gammaproteobacteria bacterium]
MFLCRRSDGCQLTTSTPQPPLLETIVPDWPAPPPVRACSTTRRGGFSDLPYQALNLADHVGDDPAAVAANRRRLGQVLALPAEPCWLRQVHGTRVVAASATGPVAEADGAFTDRHGVVCAVLTADCLPVLLCTTAGDWVAAAHAGWRGLAHGVLEAAMDAAPVAGDGLLAWLGPAIGPQSFEVGDEVRQAFLARDSRGAEAFVPGAGGRWIADLYRLARQRLAARGVHAVFGGGLCTFRDAGRFFSFRRDGRTGRMASLIWLE